MWCDNLPRNRGRLSQVTSPYKVVINNHSVTFERNPILFNCSQEFTQKNKRGKYKNLQTKSVTTSPGLPYVEEVMGETERDEPSSTTYATSFHNEFSIVSRVVCGEQEREDNTYMLGRSEKL